MKLSQEKQNRVNASIKETEKMLNKELSYQTHLQNNDRLNFLNGHIEKLKGML